MRTRETMSKFSSRLAMLLGSALLALLTFAPPAPADFGIQAFDGQIPAAPPPSPLPNPGNLSDSANFAPMYTQAGGHPYSYTTEIRLNRDPEPVNGAIWPGEPVRNILVDLPVGLVGNPTRVEQCRADQLVTASARPNCPPTAQVGYAVITYSNCNASGCVAGTTIGVPMFSMVPPAGVPARFGFNFAGTIVSLDARVRSGDDYGISVDSRLISEGLPLVGATVTFWGSPHDPVHDPQRACPGELPPAGLGGKLLPGPSCSAGFTPQALLTLPTSCNGPLHTDARADSWFHPGDFETASFDSHLPPGLPDPIFGDVEQPLLVPAQWGAKQGLTGCDTVPFKPSLSAQPSALEAETATGLTVSVDVPQLGLVNPEGIATSHIKAAKVSLPEGVTINPSQAEGLGVCSLPRYASTELSFHPTPDTGCPDNSKIGTVQVQTPLLEENLLGDVYVAQQDDPRTSLHGAENPFDSLLAIYVVIKSPEKGILVKLPGKVETDPTTGRIVTTFDDLPQLPFSSFDFKFREGARAPLVTPPSCGTYETEADFVPWSDPSHIRHTTSTFQVTKGVGGGPCPPGGLPTFNPGFSAGALSNNAGSYSLFTMRLTRQDGEQDMTKFSSVLPPGVSAKIAGLSKCPDAAIAAAKAKTHTGRDELASPSCPDSSKIGRTLVGAGVGSVLTYVPGSLYLGGPYHGAPLSVVSITPAVAGPFDVGTVVVQEALTLDPVTAEVHVDGDRSDPIPHILEGIPLKLRDLRVYVDRPDFTVNPTSCDPSQVGATLFGSYLDVLNPSDDRAVSLASRFQAANCASLGFKPKLAIKLKGGTHRGAHPALKATVTPRAGDANIAGAVVKLPRSAFLDQAHIRTICTRVQFAADACPKGAVYGHVKAFTPLLDEPLEGPVYLRSSNHKLPDLVFDLHGVVDIEVAGRIDSVKGGIRSSFDAVPDAPVSRVLLQMQGARKGLIVNSRDLCARKSRASAELTGQNGKVHDSRPVLRAGCGKSYGGGGQAPGRG
jgi:hypothetical protein